MWYYPEKVCHLPSGLAIYKSWYKNADGTGGVIGGPHRGITEIESSHQVIVRSFLRDQYKLFKSGYQLNPNGFNVACDVQEGSFKWCIGQYISIQ